MIIEGGKVMGVNEVPNVEDVKKEARGFFSLLFDFSFSEFIVLRVVKIIYGLILLLIGIGGLGVLIGGFKQSFGYGLVTLLVILPLYLLISIVFARIYMEIIIVIFKINENLQKLVDKK